jgi:hypothetical protein
MKHISLIALTLLLCGVMTARAGALAQQAADPSEAGNANGATGSTLEIAPNYPQPAENQPGSSDAGTAAPQTGDSSAAAPDAGTAQDYATNQGSNAAPLPNFAGIDDYVNQQASYESVSTGLPPMVLLPPYAYYPYSPYYYPRFYSPPRPPILMMPSPPHPVIASPKIRTPVHPPPPYHPPPPPAHHSSFGQGPPPGHRGFQHR